MEGFVVTCPLAPSVPHLLSGSCSSPRAFGLGFLQTPPHDEALALLLAFGSAKTWHGDFHPISSVPCPAHTSRLTSRARARSALSRLFGLLPSLDDFGQPSKGLVDCLMIGKVFSHIRVDNHHIGTFGVPLGVLPPNSAAEIIFLKHAWIIPHFLHNGVSPCWSRVLH